MVVVVKMGMATLVTRLQNWLHLKGIKGIIKRVEPCKCDTLLISRIL